MAFPFSSRSRTAAERQEDATALITTIITQPRREALRMFVRIRQQLLDDPNAVPWLAAAHALHARGKISRDVLRYLTAIFVECITAKASESDPELCAIRLQMEAIEEAAGLNAEQSWTAREAPAAWRALDERWNVRSDEVNADYLRSQGHDELADEMEHGALAFSAAGVAGRVELWGPG